MFQTGRENFVVPGGDMIENSLGRSPTPDQLEGVADQTGRPALFLVGHPAFKSYEIVYPRDLDLVDPIYSTTVLDIEGIGQRAYTQDRWFTEVPTEWIAAEFFSKEYREAVFEALTNRFTEGGRW